MTMTKKNIEVVQRHYEAFNRGDMEGTLAPLDEDIVFVEDPDLRPDAGTYRGMAAIRDYFQQMWDSAARVENRPEVGIQPEEFIEHEDKVIVPTHLYGRFKLTGIEGETPSFVHVWTVEGDKIARLHIYTDKAQALDAIGLREAGVHRGSSS